MYGLKDADIDKVAFALNVDAYAIVGRLVKLKEWALSNAAGGWGDGVTKEWLDWYCSLPGLAVAIEAVTWIAIADTGVRFTAWLDEIVRREATSAATIVRVNKWRTKQRNRPTAAQLTDFEFWWQSFPRRQNKVKAREAWRLLDPDEELQAVILEATARQSKWEQWTREGGKFIPHPTTWLRGRRWEDEEAQAEDRQAGTLDWMHEHGVE